MRISALRRVGLMVVLFGVTATATFVAAPAHGQQVFPCDSSGPGNYSKVSRPPEHGFLPQEVVSIPSALDGVSIQIGLVRPDVPEGMRVPVIVEASPYYHPLQGIDLRTCKARLTENFVPQGYAVALVAVRGSADSGGCMNLFGPKERADLNQAVTWLAERPWSSGAVGMTGLSYNGSTPWEVASFGNPYLKTIVPASGVPDLFDLLFGGGVPDWRGPTTIINNVYYAESAAFYLPGRSFQSTAEVLACPEYVDGNGAAIHSGVTGEFDPFNYWAQRRYRPSVEERYRGSILLVQGLQDWNVNPGLQFPWVNDLVERSRRDDAPGEIAIKYMLGQWGHSLPDGRRSDWADILLRWFDYWLLEERNVDLGPTAEVQDSSGKWRASDAWPPAGTDTTWLLTTDGRLSSAASDPTGAKRVMVDPFHLQGGGQQINLPNDLRERCEAATCAQFRTEPFSEEFRFAGRPKVRLTVTPQGPGGQLSVYLFSVAEGQVQRLGWGQVDLRFPNGIPSETPKAQAVTAGAQMVVDFPLQPLDAVVPRAGQLVMIVSEGSAYNRLPTMPNYPIDIAVGGEQSALTVTQITPAPDEFFTPGSG